MIMIMTISIYMGSSIFSPAIMDAMQYFGLGQVPTTLGISLFVIGYGIGPLFLSPLVSRARSPSLNTSLQPAY